MPRKSHKKSKTGCPECKRRHIKCDETRRSCVNCVTAGLRCPYQDDDPSAGESPAITAQANAISPATAAAIVTNPDLNILHLELMYHFTAETCKTISQNKDLFEIYRRCIMNCAVHHPFLMYEVLAISALHLSTLKPEKRTFYAEVARSFQAKALAGLDNILMQVDGSNCMVVLLFSHLISLHSFHDAFTSAAAEGTGNIVNGLIQSMSLSRGIEAIIQPWWNFLMDTEMSPLMRDANHRRSLSSKRQGDETRDLIELVESADIGEASRATYLGTITRLQRDFDEVDSLTPAQLATVNSAFAWLVTSSPAYITLLDEQRPEALIILSYFAVILHRRRQCWIINDTGRLLVNSITLRLGRRWEDRLAWPKAQILGTP